MKEQEVIVNMTINQMDFDNWETTRFIDMLIDSELITALGVSVTSIDRLPSIEYKNLVYHVIAGITPIVMIEELINRKEKILILGYKTKGRGMFVKPTRMVQLQENIKRLLTLNESIISFDNLALEQLDIKQHVGSDIWEQFYMGEEGQYSFYIDTVKEQFYQSSTSTNLLGRVHVNILSMFAEC